MAKLCVTMPARLLPIGISEDQTALHKAIRTDVFKWDLKHDFYNKMPQIFAVRYVLTRRIYRKKI